MNLSRREVDSDASRGEFEARVVERSAHAVARLAYFGVRQADDVKRWQPRPEMHLDGDLGRINSCEPAARDRGDRHQIPRVYTAEEQRGRAREGLPESLGFQVGYTRFELG